MRSTAIAKTSAAAFKSFGHASETLRGLIVDVVEAFGIEGCIMDDIQIRLGIEQNSTISGLITPLINAGEIYRNGDTRVARSGRQQMVLRHIKYAEERPVIPRPPREYTPFEKGILYAAKLLVESPDLDTAKAKIKKEVLKIKEKA